jgi:hypothetical protein
VLATGAIALGLLVTPIPAAAEETLGGTGNNVRHPAWGAAGSPYLRVAPPRYANGVGRMVRGPSPRFVSNRVFNDLGVNVFSENGLSQWAWAWGQFLDHDMGLRVETGGPQATLPFDAGDPLERFQNDLGGIPFSRTPAAPGTGVKGVPRQQTDRTTSYIDASNIYGTTRARLDWLRAGRLDGDPGDNAAHLMLPGGYLPRPGARGRPKSAPFMQLTGPLMGNPGDAAVAGDVRANDNHALTAIQTLFAREHNRIVALLPRRLAPETRFQVARRVVSAEEQFITYHEFLPALGVRLPRYRGYRPRVDAGISQEFAVVGFRAHSMIHGDFNARVPAGRLSPEQISALREQGMRVREKGTEVLVQTPLTASFGNPDLVRELGLGPVLRSLAEEHQYRNDELIDDALRSVLFQVPKPGAVSSTCGIPQANPSCYTGVLDLGAIDIQRGRDHGIPTYNRLRRAYGLAPARSFAALTGEPTQSFTDPAIAASDPLDDPRILDFTAFFDAAGNQIDPEVVDPSAAQRRSTLAARLKAIYGNVSRLDAIVGMMAEPHIPGSDLGPLQRAIWRRQFRALRDGDRFFYLNDPQLRRIKQRYGIDYRRTLSSLIALDTGMVLPRDLFHFPPAP